MLKTLTALKDTLGPGTGTRAAILVLLMVFGGLLESVGVGLVFPVLAVVADANVVQSDNLMSKLYGWADKPAIEIFFYYLCGALVAAIAVKNLFAVYLLRRQAEFVWESRRRLTTFLFRRYVRAELLFHLQNSSSATIRSLTVSVDQIFGKFLMPLMQLATEAFVVIFIFLMLLRVSPEVTGVALAMLGSTAAVFHYTNRRRIGFWGAEMHDTSARLLQTISHSLGGIKEVKVFQKERFFEQEFDDAMARNSTALKRYQVVTQYPRIVIETLAVCCIVLAVVAIVGLGNPIRDAIPILGLFCMAALRLMPSFNRIIGHLANIRFVLPSINQVLAEIKATEKADSIDDAQQVEPVPFGDRIKLNNVGFSYSEMESNALHDICLDLKFGESVALVGRTGAGKTTLANLLLGLLEPTDGELRVDGQLISHSNLHDWRSNVAYIPQDVFLVDDTILANVAFGVEEAEIDEARLQEAVKLARLQDVVENSPHGLATRVGERGAQLSGGQRQRIGIARALYRDARLLVLDEATSALDASTESEITGLLRSLHGQRTFVLIAHRLSTVRHCDKIYLLDDGRIVSTGTFEMLASQNALFKEMLDHSQVAVDA